MTPARLEANRRNAQKSTGPRTARGKAQSRLNGLRTGGRSRLYHDILMTLLYAPPCAVGRWARAMLTPELAAQPVLAELVAMLCQAEGEVALSQLQIERLRELGKKSLFVSPRPKPGSY